MTKPCTYVPSSYYLVTQWLISVGNRSGWAGTLFALFGLIVMLSMCCIKYSKGNDRHKKNMLLLSPRISVRVIAVLTFVAVVAFCVASYGLAEFNYTVAKMLDESITVLKKASDDVCGGDILNTMRPSDSIVATSDALAKCRKGSVGYASAELYRITDNYPWGLSGSIIADVEDIFNKTSTDVLGLDSTIASLSTAVSTSPATTAPAAPKTIPQDIIGHAVTTVHDLTKSLTSGLMNTVNGVPTEVSKFASNYLPSTSGISATVDNLIPDFLQPFQTESKGIKDQIVQGIELTKNKIVDFGKLAGTYIEKGTPKIANFTYTILEAEQQIDDILNTMLDIQNLDDVTTVPRSILLLLMLMVAIGLLVYISRSIFKNPQNVTPARKSVGCLVCLYFFICLLMGAPVMMFIGLNDVCLAKNDIIYEQLVGKQLFVIPVTGDTIYLTEGMINKALSCSPDASLFASIGLKNEIVNNVLAFGADSVKAFNKTYSIMTDITQDIKVFHEKLDRRSTIRDLKDKVSAGIQDVESKIEGFVGVVEDIQGEIAKLSILGKVGKAVGLTPKDSVVIADVTSTAGKAKAALQEVAAVGPIVNKVLDTATVKLDSIARAIEGIGNVTQKIADNSKFDGVLSTVVDTIKCNPVAKLYEGVVNQQLCQRMNDSLLIFGASIGVFNLALLAAWLVIVLVDHSKAPQSIKELQLVEVEVESEITAEELLRPRASDNALARAV